MTRYRVAWVRSATDELAEVWLAASDRQLVSSAAGAVDWELSTDAPLKGREVHEGLRALVVPPLRILFAVREHDRIVEVLRVRPL